jgi:transposase
VPARGNRPESVLPLVEGVFGGRQETAGDTARAATSDEVKDLRREASALKEVVAELTLENRLLKKSLTADGEDAA